MFRNSFVKVNLDHYRYNLRYFMANSGKKVMAIVKANAYGLVDSRMAAVCEEEGVDIFGVSSLDEALELRSKGFREDILILGNTSAEYFNVIKDNNISIVTTDKEYCMNNFFKGVRVHLKLNTGMNRIGIYPKDAKEVLDKLLSDGAIVEGIMTHYACADCDLEFTEKQYEKFRNCVESLNYPFRYIHGTATDATLLSFDKISTHCRIGIGLLGFDASNIELKPCVSLFGEIVSAKKVEKGEGVGYGQKYISDGSGYILTVGIGYADGFLRANSGKEVYCEDEYGFVAGNVCMDQLMVYTEHYHKPGSMVELLGEHISIEKRAKELGTISYEIISILGDRLSRAYEENGKIIEILDPRFDYTRVLTSLEVFNKRPENS